ncbi:GRB10-interacting GYF protein 2-like [Procambarus clarkii]|uniref:GRB10-interacting GYF protein 2-like n=1 Tax=Procambarus clarkii TaxID=6728 RepID=UPI003742AED9
MEDDKVAKFIDTRDEQVLEDCTKAQLQLIADHFGIKLRSCKQEDRRVRERDLPVFVPNEAEGLFDHFERVATLKKWPRTEWAELVQGRLTGEARKAYNMLDLKECTNYEAAVLHSFSLTPKCYRKRFRECTRSPGKSYAETARDMERKFLKWLESEGAKSAEEVKRLIVMEKFMSVLSPEIRIRVKEADIKDLRAAADRADMLEEALRRSAERSARWTCDPVLRREEREHEAQLRREEREAQLKREELEAQLKQQEIEANREVELKRAELGLALPAPPQQEDRRERERDLPVFVPNEAEGLFDHFERVATLKKWPRTEWAELV